MKVGVFHHLPEDGDWFQKYFTIDVKWITSPDDLVPPFVPGTEVKYKSKEGTFTALICPIIAETNQQSESEAESDEYGTPPKKLKHSLPQTVASSQKKVPKIKKPVVPQKTKIKLITVAAPGTRVDISNAENSVLPGAKRSPYKISTPIKQNVNLALTQFSKKRLISSATQTKESFLLSDDNDIEECGCKTGRSNSVDIGLQTDYDCPLQDIDAKLTQIKSILENQRSQSSSCTPPRVCAIPSDDEGPTCSRYLPPTPHNSKPTRPEFSTIDPTFQLSITPYVDSEATSIQSQQSDQISVPMSPIMLTPRFVTPLPHYSVLKPQHSVQFSRPCFAEPDFFMSRRGPPTPGQNEVKLLPSVLAKIAAESRSEMYLFAQLLTQELYFSHELLNHSYNGRAGNKPPLSPRRKHLMEHALLDTFGPSNFSQTLATFRSQVSMSITNLSLKIQRANDRQQRMNPRVIKGG